MDIETIERFQNDLDDLNAFQTFLNMDQIIRRIHCNKQLARFCAPLRTKPKRRRRRFNPLIDLRENEFQYSYRFSKDSMKRIIEMIKDDLEIEQQQHNSTNDEGHMKMQKSQVPVEKQIMAAVRYWGRTEHPEVTAQIHGVTLKTLMKISKRVAEALSYNASRYIRMPCLLAEKEKVAKGFYDLAHMPQVIGAVNHTQMKCKRNKIATTTEQPEPNIAEHMLHIQIVTDASLKIRDLDCHLAKAAERKTPADIFAQSRIKERFEQNEFRGRLLLGDSVLKCSSYLYTPVLYAVTLSEQAYNSSLRLTHEPARKCLKLLEKRFGILNDEFHGSHTTARHIVVALVLLHNMALEWKDVAIDITSLKDAETQYYETPINTEERSRAEFIKNHFSNFKN
ncbi:putative nuclease HARBI1 [Musca autumnalis]|uniref:putative nuclease HARBI1 n=1 Tax=Musca autumnalis TaxID=221902 RepID=UPI003CFABE8F